jgi:hypothetical protein
VEFELKERDRRYQSMRAAKLEALNTFAEGIAVHT